MNYVYFIEESVPDGFIKIGKTTDPDFRLNALQLSNARKLVITGIGYGSGITERYFHKAFEYAYIGREWFNPVPDLTDYISKLPTWEEAKNGSSVIPYLTAGEDEIIALYDAGWSLHDIGNRWGVSRQAIQQMMTKMGKGRRSRVKVVSRQKSEEEVNSFLAFLR